MKRSSNLTRTSLPGLMTQFCSQKRNGLAPVEWPEGNGGATGRNSASRSFGGGRDVAALLDNRLRLPVVVGPLDGIDVNDRVLDFRRGVGRGVANLNRMPPLMRNFSTYRFRVENNLIENEFQYYTMGIGNQTRRMPLIYEYLFPAELQSTYYNAIQAIETAPFRPALKPLDADEEFLNHPTHPHIPDFHPGVGGFCTLDYEEVEDVVERATDRVEQVPRRMARAYIRLYEAIMEELPEFHPGRAMLEAKIEQYEEFLSMLDEDEPTALLPVPL